MLRLKQLKLKKIKKDNMGLGPMNLGGAGTKKGVHNCGTTMSKKTGGASGSPIKVIPAMLVKIGAQMLAKKAMEKSQE